jgi:hypothetical protein
MLLALQVVIDKPKQKHTTPTAIYFHVFFHRLYGSGGSG